MNKIYKVIWSKTRNCYVAVSELAKSHTKGCSGKRIGRVLASGLVVAAVMLPMGDAGAFSSSYADYNYSSGFGDVYPMPDFQSNGGQQIIELIGGQYPDCIYVNSDGTVNYYSVYGNSQRIVDNSTNLGNVAVGNFSSAGTTPNFKNYYLNNYSLQIATETQPSSYYSTTTFNGKTYYITNNRIYQRDMYNNYNPNGEYSFNVIETEDGKKYYKSFIM